MDILESSVKINMSVVPLSLFKGSKFPKMERLHTVLYCKNDDDATEWFDALDVENKVDLRGQSLALFDGTQEDFDKQRCATPLYTLIDSSHATPVVMAQARSLGRHIVLALTSEDDLRDMSVVELNDLTINCFTSAFTSRDRIGRSLHNIGQAAQDNIICIPSHMMD